MDDNDTLWEAPEVSLWEIPANLLTAALVVAVALLVRWHARRFDMDSDQGDNHG